MFNSLQPEFAGTHQTFLWCFPYHIPASLDQVGCGRPAPPVCTNDVKHHVLCKEGTHTRTHVIPNSESVGFQSLGLPGDPKMHAPKNRSSLGTGTFRCWVATLGRFFSSSLERKEMKRKNKKKAETLKHLQRCTTDPTHAVSTVQLHAQLPAKTRQAYMNLQHIPCTLKRSDAR